MDPGSGTDDVYRFAPFRLDVRERLLTAGDQPVPLRAKAFDTLVALVRNAGRLLTREDLFDAVWPDAVVEESNIAHNISQLRRTLAEHSDRTFIETVPKRGYRFAVLVEREAATPARPEEDDLVLGRRAFERCEWDGAYARLKAAAGGQGFVPEDWSRLAEAALWSGHYDERTAALEGAIDAHRDAGNGAAAARTCIELATLHLDQRQFGLAKNRTQQALTLVPAEPPSDIHACVAWMENRLLWPDEDWAAAHEQARRAAELAGAVGCRDAEALALLDVVHTRLAQGQFGDAPRIVERAEAIVMEGGLSRYASGFVFCSLIVAWRACGDWGRAAEWTEALTRWCDRSGVAFFPGSCRVHRGELICLRGQLAEAEVDLERGCAELSRADSWMAGFGFRELGDVRLKRGDLAGAEEAYRHAVQFGTEPQPGMARLRFLRGEVREACRDLQRLLEGDGGPAVNVFVRENRPYVLPVFTTVAIANGDLPRARAAAEELAALAEQTGSDAQQASAIGALGEVLLAEGDLAGAAGQFRQCWSTWCRLDAPYEAAVARQWLGETLLREGDQRGARIEFASAAATFERIGARIDLDRVRGRLDALPSERGAESPGRATAAAVVVGGDALAQVLGEDAWRNLNGWLERQVIALGAGHGGRKVRDGAWIKEFESAKAAASWARATQDSLQRHGVRSGFAPPVSVAVVPGDGAASAERAVGLASAGKAGDVLESSGDE